MNYIYHVFSSNFLPIYKFTRYPTVLSIASLRNFDEKSSVFVIDRTPNFHDWEDYPKKLNFEVIKNTNPKIDSLPLLQNRLRDIKDFLPFLSGDITYIDSDVFWVKKFTPKVLDNKISMILQKNKYWYANSGFFNFKKNSLGHEYFNIWEDTLANWKNQKSLSCFLKNFYGSDLPCHVGDEGIMGFLINRRGWLEKINPCKEPTLIDNQKKTKISNLIHILSNTTSDKIKIVFRIKELNNILRKKLDIEQIKKFGCGGEFHGDLDLENFEKNVQIFKKTQDNIVYSATGNKNINDKRSHRLFFI